MARATAQAAKSGTRPSQVTDGLPARDCWTGATSRRRVDGRAHPTLPDAVPGIERGGSLPPRPHPPERHRRSCGRGATATPPATCGIGGAHIGMAMPCTSTPMSMCTRGTPPTPADRRSRSAPRKPARTPCREPVDRRSGPRGPEQVLHLDDPLEAALQPAMLLIYGSDRYDGELRELVRELMNEHEGNREAEVNIGFHYGMQLLNTGNFRSAVQTLRCERSGAVDQCGSSGTCGYRGVAGRDWRTRKGMKEFTRPNPSTKAVEGEQRDRGRPVPEVRRA